MDTDISDSVFVGQISLFAGNLLPYGWLWCNGQTLRIQEYAALFSIIDYTFGGSPKQQVFAVPDLRGCFPLGAVPKDGDSPAGRQRVDLGSRGGGSALKLENIPEHTHKAHLNGKLTDVTMTPVLIETRATGVATSSSTVSSSGTPGLVLANAKLGPASIPMYTAPPSPLQNTLGGVTGGDFKAPSFDPTFALPAVGSNPNASLMPPFLALNYAIAYAGPYPERP